MKDLQYCEVLIKDYTQGIISKGAFNQLLLKDEKLREWFQLHQIFEKTIMNDNGGMRLQRRCTDN